MLGVEGGAHGKVLFADVRHGDGVVDFAENEFEDLVDVEGGGIVECKEGMVCEDGFVAERLGMEEELTAKEGGGGVGVDDVDFFADEDLPKEGKAADVSEEDDLVVQGDEGAVVDFEAVGHVANTGAALVAVGEDDDLVAALHET